MIESLDVILWDKKVGTLVASREGHRSKACFYFDSDYVRDGYDIAPLRAPVKGVAAQRGYLFGMEILLKGNYKYVQKENQ